MIETIVLNYLKSSGVQSYMEMPENYAPPLCIVEKLGSGKENQIPSATMAVQSYGASLYAAAALNEQVKARMEALAERPEICRVRLNSDYNYTDTQTKRYRYQAVFDITYYEEA